jgi:hypothetical protein
VDVDVARGVGDARHVMTIRTGRIVSGAEHVLETPDLKQGGDHQTLRIGPQPHGACQKALVEGDASLLVDANEVEPPGLV